MDDTTHSIIDMQSPDYESRSRLVAMGLPAFYASILVATIIDGILGRSMMAFWSLLLVMTIGCLLVQISRLVMTLDSRAAWLWQIARCIALSAGIGLAIGLGMMLLGDGTSTTISRGLGLSSFSVLYGVLIALPAGCAVAMLDRSDQP